ncbi:MAG: DUF5615 family PIN-like protein [Verrucomicrobia bacterium]|nr:DUF5615 family PIN-like protein [Verrucomicrobiota bacterium]
MPDEIARLLGHWGHEARRLRDALPPTTPDEDVFAYAQANVSLILSCNRQHFLGLAKEAIQRQMPFAGLIILIRRRTRQMEGARLLALFRRAGETGLTSNINLA